MIAAETWSQLKFQLPQSCCAEHDWCVLKEKLAELEAQLLEERKHLRNENEARKKTETENQYLLQARDSLVCRLFLQDTSQQRPQANDVKTSSAQVQMLPKHSSTARSEACSTAVAGTPCMPMRSHSLNLCQLAGASWQLHKPCTRIQWMGSAFIWRTELWHVCQAQRQSRCLVPGPYILHAQCLLPHSPSMHRKLEPPALSS